MEETLGPCSECAEGYAWSGGYRRIVRNSKMVYAHRWAWEQENGPVPEGLEIGHRCHNPKCWRRDHLEAVTHAENMRQRSERQTHCLRGHEFTAENTGRYGNDNRRRCKACARGYYHGRKQNALLNELLTEGLLMYPKPDRREAETYYV